MCKHMCTNALARSSWYKFQLRRSHLWTKAKISWQPVTLALCSHVQKNKWEAGCELSPSLTILLTTPVSTAPIEHPAILGNTAGTYADVRQTNENACSLICSWALISGHLIHTGFFLPERGGSSTSHVFSPQPAWLLDKDIPKWWRSKFLTDKDLNTV